MGWAAGSSHPMTWATLCGFSCSDPAVSVRSLSPATRGCKYGNLPRCTRTLLKFVMRLKAPERERERERERPAVRPSVSRCDAAKDAGIQSSASASSPPLKSHRVPIDNLCVWFFNKPPFNNNNNNNKNNNNNNKNNNNSNNNNKPYFYSIFPN